MQVSRVSDNSKKDSNLEGMNKEDMYNQYMANEMRHKKMLKDNFNRRKQTEKKLKENKNNLQQERKDVITDKKNAMDFYTDKYQKEHVKHPTHVEKPKFIPSYDIFDDRYYQ